MSPSLSDIQRSPPRHGPFTADARKSRDVPVQGSPETRSVEGEESVADEEGDEEEYEEEDEEEGEEKELEGDEGGEKMSQGRREVGKSKMKRMSAKSAARSIGQSSTMEPPTTTIVVSRGVESKRIGGNENKKPKCRKRPSLRSVACGDDKVGA